MNILYKISILAGQNFMIYNQKQYDKFKIYYLKIV